MKIKLPSGEIIKPVNMTALFVELSLKGIENPVLVSDKKSLEDSTAVFHGTIIEVLDG